MKRNLAISFLHAMPNDPGEDDSADVRRPTAVDSVMQRFNEKRAEDLKLDWKTLVKKTSSRSTAWRAEKTGITYQHLRAIDAELAEVEADRGLRESRGALLQQWNAIGAELLMLDDGQATYRRVVAEVRKVLAKAKDLESGISAFGQPTPDNDR